MNYKNFFLLNNSSGNKTKETFLLKNHKEIYEKIILYIKENNLNENLSFKEKIFLFMNDIKEEPKCENCNEKLKFKKSLKEGYGVYCSLKCTNQSEKHKENIKNTFNKKYNGHPMKNDVVKQKYRNTNLKKYDVENIFKNTEYIKNKNLIKLGVTNPNKLDCVKEKRINTNIEKYGVSTNLIDFKSRKNNHLSKLKKFNEKYKKLKIINDKGDYISIQCDKCNLEYEIERSLLFYRFENNINCCTICNKVNELRSIKEKEIYDFIVNLGIETINSDRTILNGKEIDIYIPSKKIGFEFNGLFYHSDLYKDKYYHINKTNECLKKDIRLIHIFEDEWDSKKEIVKSRIKNLLGLNEKRIFGRKCVIKNVSTKEKTKFLNENHIQGAVGSLLNYGLYYNNELVSLMTFGNGRKIMNGLNYEWELLRFCNKINHTVIGSASKLLNHFIKTHQPKNIVSYADIRWSNGDLYEKLNFVKIRTSNPNYYYVINKKRENRFKFRKDELIRQGFCENLTEYEIMEKRGINRIYDCGNLVYIISL